MAIPDTQALQALTEGGPGLRFTVATKDGEAEAFAVRFCGQVRGWLNRCPHRGTQLDWMPGEFFDDERRYLVCATHGALFEPDSGLCIGGPCKGQRLTRVGLTEEIAGTSSKP